MMIIIYMGSNKSFDGIGKLLNKLAIQSAPNQLTAPIVNDIDQSYQQDKFFLFEYELDNPDRKLSLVFREIIMEHTSSFILFSPSVFLVTNIRNIKKFITDIASRSEELYIINFALIAIEKGYIVSNWLKRI